jgi:ABC-type nitrate/sulfonate/bicarbonate transport system substrate-binding protein
MNKKTRVLTVVAIIITIAILGCIAQETDKTSKDTMPKDTVISKETILPKEDKEELIKVDGYIGIAGVSIGYNIPKIAEELGYLNGIKLEETEIGVGPAGLAAVSNGQIDAAHVQWLTIARAVAKGTKIKAVALAHDPNVIVFRLFVLEDSPIKSAKDLKDKKLGGFVEGTTPSIVLAEYLKKNGLTIQDVDLITVPTGQSEQVLKNKQVDAILVATTMEAGYIKEHGGVRLLATLDDYLPKGNNGTHHCGLIVSEKFIKEKPELLKRFIDGFVKAADWQRDNPDKARELDIKWTKEAGANPEPFLKGFIPPSSIRNHALVEDSDIQWFIDRLVERGELKKDQIKPTDLYTNEFNPYYVK